MNRFPFLYLLISCFLTVNFSFSQKAERIGYINMEYILSQMEDYKTANAQLEDKIGKWKNEIEIKKTNRANISGTWVRILSLRLIGLSDDLTLINLAPYSFLNQVI